MIWKESGLKRNAFGKSLRLTENEEFRSVIGQRLRFSNSILTIYVAKNGLEYSRLGVSIGRAAGPAVVRNRIKRLLREAFRLNRAHIAAGFNIVVLPGKEIRKNLKFNIVEASLLKLVEQAAGRSQ